MSRRDDARTHAKPQSAAPPPAEGDAPPRPRSGMERAADAVALMVALACVLVSVSYRLSDYDLWQHLLVGRVLWQQHAIPNTHLWSWPTYGSPEALPAWGFRALLWPFYDAGGVAGIFAWRWLAALATFGAAWAAARAAGTRGIAGLVVVVLASLTYRIHARVGPETLSALLFALTLWVLASRRARLERRAAAPGGEADPAMWLPAIALAWVNVDDTYWLLFLLVAVELAARGLTAAISRRARDATSLAPRATLRGPGLAWLALGALAISFVNPGGWETLWRPFDFLLHGRGDAIVHALRGQRPLDWGAHVRSGLPLLVLGWPALAAWRAVRAGVDWTEVLGFAALLGLVFYAERFAIFFVIAAVPWVARDLDAWLRTLALPRALTSAPVRVGLVGLACVGAGLPEWSRAGYPPGVAIEMDRYPVRACDFISAHGILGRGFVPSSLGAYLMWRFWPDRGRLPFTDSAQNGTRDDRELYAYAFSQPQSWRTLDERHHFDYVLLDGHEESGRGDRLLDVLDADTTWTLVFRDDAAALYVRREGPLAPVAQRYGYLFVPGGEARIPLLGRACQVDTLVRRFTRIELERQVATSPLNARAYSLLGTIDWISGRRAEAERNIEAALARDPRTVGAHQRLGLMRMAQGRDADAVREFKQELALGYGSGDLSFFLGRAYGRLGDLREARRWYGRSLDLDPRNAAARESLEALGARSGAR
jgi:tetratricopeptide repeat protein